MVDGIWDRLGIVWGSFWDRWGIVLGSLGANCGLVWMSFWNIFGIGLGSVGIILGSFGIILGSVWDHLGIGLGIFFPRSTPHPRPHTIHRQTPGQPPRAADMLRKRLGIRMVSVLFCGESRFGVGSTQKCNHKTPAHNPTEL